MCRVLFVIPGLNLPVFGFGVCLVAGVFLGTMLAARLARRDGIDPLHIWDFMVPLLFSGILGARLFYVAQFHEQFRGRWLDVFKIWEGGLVVYGSALGMFLATAWHCWRRSLPVLRFLDAIAPAFALGLACGRIGCLLNGCCFGDAGGPWPVTYPPASDATQMEMQRGLRTPFGFGTEPGRRPAEPRRVAFVEPGTPAANAGLREGDDILELQGLDARGEFAYLDAVDAVWPAFFGVKAAALPLRVLVGRGPLEVPLAFAVPGARASHPTQLYMAVGNFLLLLLLLAHRPLRTKPGQTVGLMFTGYAVGRFLVEFVRADENPFANGLTISQNLSIPMFAIGLLLLWLAPRPRLAISA